MWMAMRALALAPSPALPSAPSRTRARLPASLRALHPPPLAERRPSFASRVSGGGARRRPAPRASSAASSAAFSAASSPDADPPPTTRASPTWRDNPFESFCAAARARPAVSEGLRVLEHRHPEIDPTLVLFAAWLASRPGPRALTHAELRRAAKVSERWRWRVGDGLRRVEASLRGPDLMESPPAARLADAVAALDEEVLRATRAALCELADSWAWWEAEGAEGAKGAEGEKTRGGSTVRGATARACANLRTYLEYAGATLAREDHDRLRGVFEGCMSASPGGWSPSSDVELANGEVAGSKSGSGDEEVFTDAGWRAALAAVDQSRIKPKTEDRRRRNERYHRARRHLAEADRRWKAASEDYKNARSAVKRARHEVHKTRKAVRVEFR